MVRGLASRRIDLEGLKSSALCPSRALPGSPRPSAAGCASGPRGSSHHRRPRRRRCQAECTPGHGGSWAGWSWACGNDRIVVHLVFVRTAVRANRPAGPKAVAASLREVRDVWPGRFMIAGLTAPSLPARKGLLTPERYFRRQPQPALPSHRRGLSRDTPRSAYRIRTPPPQPCRGRVGTLPGRPQLGGQQHQRIAMPGSPFHCLDAHGRRNPDRRMGLERLAHGFT